jgi:fatty acid desaturase
LVLAELLMGLVCSFYFAGFHEMIHGTAFHTRGLNKLFSHIVGFSIFRGANWYWYFHWHHHRFTNDPARDPELSGTTVDRSDPTKCQGFTSRLGAFLLFLSGYPFGFERILGMAAYAIGQPPRESWVDTEKKVKQVQQEYIVFIIGYVALAVLAVHDPATIGASLWYYWLLPHMLGAGHLRYYQTAEHRACQMGKYTDTNAWVVSRTTATWWIYSQLAWNMPYHQEHHAWPNVPFYLLPALHTKVEADGIRPESGCSPTGVNGYFWMHWKLFHSVVVGGGGDSKDASKSKPQKSS